MNTKEVVIKEGIVKESQTGGLFLIEFGPGEEAWSVLAGKLRKFKIRILPGDKVKVEFSPHDLTRGRITYRFR
ncbi:translation initiation factor IF-1 [Candidatus Nomurabacteria bacterium]|uniref:Translation initiation factor IF-1 n=1 Tax=candidate division WWE3 bacterium TaxID=2053526 RepID=A0A955E143_UNCKA|nr:translation initiation factor IF-1 [candidate division WWE3 bacterium]MCB9823761.1 translation initiation factor IF-1 [Candidatus Nomurabacteria bacterium]MCB9826833.1 translation initiation factor IF-1 [Candidatus Nomurabacteria bacterium]MCB9827556.1 translation initiation factor IF-1 [Candidatus Nomurabacteria bacterium]HXK52419.1 translation initiation factor IF-1 [bacterium]